MALTLIPEATPWYETGEHFTMPILVDTSKIVSMGYTLDDEHGNDVPVYVQHTKENMERLTESILGCFGEAVKGEIEWGGTIIHDGKVWINPELGGWVFKY